MRKIIAILTALTALTAQAGNSIKTRSGVLEVSSTNRASKLIIGGKELKRGPEIIYALPETFQSRFDINGSDVFIFAAYTTTICRYFFVVEVPKLPTKSKTHKTQTHIMCGGPVADEDVEVSQEGNVLSLTVPDYYDPKTRGTVDKTYDFKIGEGP